MLLGREPGGLPRLRREVEHHHPARPAADDRVAEIGDEQVGQHAGEPRARPEDQHVGVAHGVDGLLARLRGLGQQPHAVDTARRGGHRDLPADPVRAAGTPQPGHLGLDVQGLAAHRQHPAPDTEQCPHLVQGGDGVAEGVHEAGEQEVADGVPGERAGAAEPVLHELAPARARRIVGRERGQGHPQVAGRQQAQLPAQPARRAAVVGHRDHGRDLVGEQADGRQRGVQPVPTAQRHDPGHSRPRSLRRHSRPRSRCATLTRTPSVPSSLRAISSLMATLRCLPPVQPMETVRYRLPSRRYPAPTRPSSSR